MSPNVYTPYLPQLEKRLKNARIMHAIHTAAAPKFQETEAETLPYADIRHEQDSQIDPEEHLPQKLRRKYERCALDGLRRFRDSLAPTAHLTIVRGGSEATDYFRLTEYDEDGEPAWVIAERKQNGNGLYIWRREDSAVDPDTAFATTRRAALGHGCIRITHPAHMDTATTEQIDDFYQGKVAGILTA